MLTYEGSTINSKLSNEKDIYRRISRAASTLANLGTQNVQNPLTSRLRCQSITILFLIHFYTEANPGQHMNSRTQLKYLIHALTEEAARYMLDDQDTKHSCAVYMWKTNYIHDDLQTHTAFAGTFPKKERRKNPLHICYGKFSSGKRNLG